MTYPGSGQYPGESTFPADAPRRNQCPNPSAAVDATGWIGPGTQVRVTGQTGPPRATAVEVATTAASFTEYLGCPVATGAAAGQVWSAVGWVWSSVARTVRVALVTWNSGAFVGSGGTDATDVAMAANTWTEVRLRGTLGSGAFNQVNYHLDLPTTGTAGTLRLGSCRVELIADDAISYADGDSGGGWGWDGTPGSSTSALVSSTSHTGSDTQTLTDPDGVLSVGAEHVGSDTITLTEAAAVAVFADDVDTTSVTDVGALLAAYADADAVAGTDTGAPPTALLDGTDTVTGGEADGALALDGLDVVAVAELAELAAVAADADATAFSDPDGSLSTAEQFAGTDTWTATDGGELAVVVADTDPGTLAEAESLAVVGVDVVALAELAEPSAALLDLDAGAFGDPEGDLATAEQFAGTDTWTVTDAGELATASVDTDPAAHAEGEALGVTVVDVDTTSVSDVAVLDTADQVAGTDVLTLTDAGSLAAAVLDSETGAQGDTTSTSVTHADTDAVTSSDVEELSTANQVAGIDAVTATELAAVEVAAADVDTTAVADSSDLLASAVPLAGTDTVTGTDTGAVSVAAAGVDTGGYGETADSAAALSALDDSTVGELEALDVTTAGTESGTLAGETGGVVIGTELFSVADVATLADVASLAVLLDALDDTTTDALDELAAAAAGEDGSELAGETGVRFDLSNAAKLPLRASGAPTRERAVTGGTVTVERPVRAGRPVRDSPW